MRVCIYTLAYDVLYFSFYSHTFYNGMQSYNEEKHNNMKTKRKKFF